MKLYQVKEKVENEVYTFVLEEEDNPKQHLKEIWWGDWDLRTLKEIPFPYGRFETGDLRGICNVFYNGKLVLSWNDNANSQYPEDLTWDRKIGDLVGAAEELGKLQMMEEIKRLRSENAKLLARVKK